MTEPLDLEPIKARLAAATPGTWEWDADRRALWAPEHIVKWQACGLSDPGPDRLLRMGEEWYDEPPSAEDAALIAHAPADLAALIAEVERLHEALDEILHSATSGGVACAHIAAEALGKEPLLLYGNPPLGGWPPLAEWPERH